MKIRISDISVHKRTGMRMKIVGYRRSTDIDIQFEDGIIVEHKSYSAFKKGNIRHPRTKDTKTIRRVREDLKSAREGEVSEASNGLAMTLIEYRSATDIDIQFEDGIIAKNRTYRRFKDGRIKHPTIKSKYAASSRIKNRLGEIGKSRENQDIKIIRYAGHNDMDIMFPDGYILKNVSYTHFRDGSISRYRNRQEIEKQRKSRIGETIIAKNGLKATIIGYNKSVDITVQFEDGIVVKDIKYNNFKQGVIKHPNINASIGKRRNNLEAKKRHIGETVVNKFGQRITIIDYINTTNIVVQFDNGEIKDHVRYSTFTRGNIASKDYPPYTRISNAHAIGEVRTNNSGLKMTLVRYRKYSDIDVQFEDGVIAKHRTYGAFVKGSIKYPDSSEVNNRGREGGRYPHFKDRTGLVGKSKEGYTIQIVAYRGYGDIDVQFEDGFILRNASYDKFINNKLARHSGKRVQDKEAKIGETQVATNGMQMKVLAYRKYSDIDVQFEDGTIVEHRNYKDFKMGMIKNPNVIKKYDTHKCVKDFSNVAYLNARDAHIGETVIARCGLRATIIDYFGTSDITIQFEDGVVVEHMKYAQFNRGSIKHPDFTQRSDFYSRQRVGETKRNLNNDIIKIVGYRNYNDIDVEICGGQIIEHTSYRRFKDGTIGI